MRLHLLAGAVFLLLISIYGCASVKGRALNTENGLSVYGNSPVATNISDLQKHSERSPFPHTGGVFSLKDAVMLTIEKNPELSALSWEVKAGESLVYGAGVLPNPGIEFEAWEIGGDPLKRGIGSPEMSMRLSQIIELGGKRSRRVESAISGLDLTKWDLEIKVLDVLTDLNKAYIAVLAAQEKNSLAIEKAALAESFYHTVAARVAAGRVPPLEESLAKIYLATARLRAEDEARALEVARKRLASFWGESHPAFDSVSGDLENMVSLPSIDMDSIVENNPSLKRSQAFKEYQRSLLSLEKSHRFPDLAISGGPSRFADNDRAFIMGFSVSLPVFDRNKWNIIHAEQMLYAAGERHKADVVGIKLEINEKYSELVSSRKKAQTLLEDIIPTAMEASRIAEEGYKAGKFSYLVVLDARRALFEAQEQKIEALAVYHTAVAEMERLAGAPIGQLQESGR